MSVLSARLQAAEDERHRAAEQSTRRNLVGSGIAPSASAPTTIPRVASPSTASTSPLYRLGEILEGIWTA